jgi:tetratricopeptide (TPR) repeat protein
MIQAELASLLNNIGRADAAEQACQEALALWDKAGSKEGQEAKGGQKAVLSAVPLACRAFILAARPEPHRDLETALALMRKAIEIKPQVGWTDWSNMCLEYYGPRAWGGSEEDARLAIKLAPKRHPREYSSRYSFAYFLAPFLLLAGRTGEYEQVCRRVVEDLPENPSRGEALIAARFCVLHPTAAGAAERVVKMGEALAKSGQWNDLELAGLACCRAGLYERAVEWLEKARQRAPATDYYVGASIVWLDLAIAHHYLGRPKQAAEWLDKARRLLDPGVATGRFQGDERLRLAVLRCEAESLMLDDTTRDTDRASSAKEGQRRRNAKDTLEASVAVATTREKPHN